MKIRHLLLSLAAASCAHGLEFRGHLKSYAVHQGANNLPPDSNRIDGRFRIIALEKHSHINAELAYELIPFIRDQPLANPGITTTLSAANYRALDLKPELFPDRDDLFFLQNLDRAVVGLSYGPAELLLGRQPVSFGVSRVVAPTDIITFFNYEVIDREYRIGVDAARLRLRLGELSSAEIGFVSGEHVHWDQSALYATGRTHLFDSDLQLVVNHFRTHTLLGGALETSLGGAGLWLEAAYVCAQEIDPLVGPDPLILIPILADDYFRLTTGFDYKVTDALYLFAEYHYNGPGTTLRTDYLLNLTQVAYLQGAVYLLGTHYLTPGINYEYNALTTFSSQLLTNLTDFGAYWSGQVEYNLTANTYLEAGFYLPTNTGSQSEFGYYPSVLYLAARYYF